MTRRWPIPGPPSRTIHFLGDIQGLSAARCNNVATDVVGNCPAVAARISAGDFTNSWGAGHPSEGTSFAEAIAFTAHLGPEDFYTCMGNHDAHGYTIDQAAAAAGMPGPNFVVDLGFVVLVFAWIRCSVDHAQEPSRSTPSALDWIEDQLVEYADRKVFVIGHPTLDVPLYMMNEHAELVALFDANPCVKAYLSGHSHQPIEHSSIVQMYDTGTREIAQVNGSALVWTMPGPDWNDRICSTYLTVWDDECEVRFRDHGSRQWVAGGAPRVRRWTFPMN